MDHGTWTWGCGAEVARPSLEAAHPNSQAATVCAVQQRGTNGMQGWEQERSRFWPRSREVQGYGREVSLASQWAEGTSSCEGSSPAPVSHNLPRTHLPDSILLCPKKWCKPLELYLHWNLNWLKWNEIQNSVAVATFQTLHSHQGLVTTKLDSTECFHHHKSPTAQARPGLPLVFRQELGTPRPAAPCNTAPATSSTVKSLLPLCVPCTLLPLSWALLSFYFPDHTEQSAFVAEGPFPKALAYAI